MAASNELDLEVAPETFATLGLLLSERRKKDEFTDVQLQINDKLFPAHRVILSLHSPVLKAMISDQWSTTKICQLSNEFVDEEIMENLLNFLYTGKIKLTPDNVHPVCVAAHFLQISILLEPTVNYLCQQIVADNVLSLYMFSKSRHIDSLATCCLQFISTESEKVFQDPLILDFSFQDIQDLIIGLEKPHSNSTIRENIFYCIVHWTEKNLTERSDDLPILLENIPLKELPLKFLTETVSTHPLVKESFPCIQAVFKALAKFQAFRPEAEQNLVVVGGMGEKGITSKLMIYNSQTRTWKLLPGMKKARTHFGAAVMGKNIVVCGGYHTDKTINSVEMFEWSSQTWKELPSFRLRLGSTSMAVYKGKLYVAGGDIDNEDPLSKVLCYSFDTQKWRPVKSMNVPRMDGHLIAYKNYLYAIGGGTNTVERYEPDLDEWTMMAEMGSDPQWFGATLHRDLIYVCGEGFFKVYDPEKNVWSSLPVPVLGKGTSLVSMNGKLLAIGGFINADEKVNSIYEFDHSTQQWNEFDKMPTELAHHCSLSGPFF